MLFIIGESITITLLCGLKTTVTTTNTTNDWPSIATRKWLNSQLQSTFSSHHRLVFQDWTNVINSRRAIRLKTLTITTTSIYYDVYLRLAKSRLHNVGCQSLRSSHRISWISGCFTWSWAIAPSVRWACVYFKVWVQSIPFFSPLLLRWGSKMPCHLWLRHSDDRFARCRRYCLIFNGKYLWHLSR